MYKIILLVLLAVFSFTISGCNTLKGTGEGIKKDWEVLKRWDKEFQEKYW